MRLRACDETYFFRRHLHEGFSGGGDPEAIVLADHVTADGPDVLGFAIQPEVRDPQAEWDLRFGRVRSYLAARPMACRLPGGIVETTEFMVCPDEHRYLVGSFCSRRLVSERAGFSEIEGGVFVRETEILERDEHVVVLGSQNNVNYSHWLLENAARALLFRPLDDGTWHYLVPRLKYPFQRESLELAGLDPERILEVKPGTVTRFSEVVAVTRGFFAAPGVPQPAPAAVAALAGFAPQLDGGWRRGRGRRRTGPSRHGWPAGPRAGFRARPQPAWS